MSELPDETVPVVKEGTLTCQVARQDSTLLSDIAEAAQNRRFEELKRYSDIIYAHYTRGFLFRRTRAFDSLSEVPVLTEVRYGNRPLAQAMFVIDEVEVASSSVLYSGGPFERGNFGSLSTSCPA
jgi:hypothetical protein